MSCFGIICLFYIYIFGLNKAKMLFLIAWWFVLLLISCHIILDFACTVCCLFGDRTSFLATLYVSVFRSAVDSENGTLSRVMIYWTASMSLVRLMAVGFRTTELFCAVAVLYCLEALVAEYEGFSSGTINRRTARTISLLSFGLSLTVLVVMCILPSLKPSP